MTSTISCIKLLHFIMMNKVADERVCSER